MKRWLLHIAETSTFNFIHRQVCLEQQIVHAQQAIKGEDYCQAELTLKSVHAEALWWFENAHPTPRLTAMYAASASLLAHALWHRRQYTKAFSVLEKGRIALRHAYTRSSIPECRKRFYEHCIDALNQSLDDLTCNNSVAS